MVNLTRIYTKTGDDGTTSLGDMSRTSKNDPRLEAYATVDEANSSIGVVLAMGDIKDESIKKLLIRIQNDLFDVGADLCTPVVDNPTSEPLRVLESQIDYLENQIDHYNESLQPLRYIQARVFNAMLQSAASEHAARRRAMKSATDNADELIKSLTRLANAARQAEITQEISEIVGGADALASASTGSE